MAQKYFEHFPFLGYSIDTTGELRVATDIMQRARIRQSLEANGLIFYEYDVQDGETPEIIAAKLYGWTGYHWIVLYVNNIVDPYYDWPMSYDNLTATIRKKYTTPDQDGLQYAYSTVKEYRDIYENVIDLTTFLATPFVERTSVSIYDWEVEQNEAKRHILLLDKSFVGQIDSNLTTIMQQFTTS